MSSYPQHLITHPIALGLRAACSAAALSSLLSTTAHADPVEGGSLPLVRARADRESAAGPVNGLTAKRSATGTKTDTALTETPQSISVIAAGEIEARAATNLKEAVGYTAGVTPSVSYDAREDLISLRGFPFDWASSYLDGLQMPSSTYGNALLEPYGLERVEVLKGPASMLYGASSTGGLLNMVSKRPLADAFRELQLQLGDHDRRQLAADLSGPVGADKTWRYRLTGLLRKSANEVEFVRDNRVFIAPSLSWHPSAQTQLTLLASYQKDDLGQSGGTQAFLPASGIALPNPNGKISRRTNGGEPGFDFYKKEQRALGYEVEHRFDPHWALQQSLRWRELRLDYQSGYGMGLDADDAKQRTLKRSAFGSFGGNKSLSADTRLLTNWGTEALAHTSMLGLDYRHSKVDERNYFGAAPSIDIFAPVYGANMVLPAVPDADQTVENRQLGLYLQDQLKIAQRWTVTLGLRWDASRNKVSERRSPDTALTKNESQLTGRAGLNYLFDNGLSPYLSVATSFTPTLDPNAYGEPFDARTGKQFELGLKYQPLGSDSLVTAAVFDIRQRNTLTADPDQAKHPFGQVQTGEYRSRGFELEARTQFDLGAPRALGATVAYTYLDPKYTKAAPGAELLPFSNLGRAPKGIAKHSGSLWLDYRLPLLKGSSVALGARYVGERPNTDMEMLGVPNSRFMLPAFTVFDAALRYETGAYRLALNLANLADKEIYDCWGDRCWYGAGRSLRATLSYNW
ncbi:iron complex outermembrane receptor protein [Paucibacter oligotrophus]|uniref:Iron complex outermembrane receptor protein n=1 Tax=Roseateles oligotrophus TaxID=1769250 RepID=A0A840L3E5_9BURK|nr:TonB-dependent siderophore receptor [Roseateles oligotrophus]MBB4842341.1 iron complex outermembrane receptor protein [Roseateles oligotrophus]